jgi:hypothetical protein
MRLLIGKDRKEVVKNISLEGFPETLLSENIWMQLSLVDDEDIGIGVVACAYRNDSVKNLYPEGSIVISNKIRNSSPSVQSSWSMNNNISRIYTDVELRNKNITLSAILVNNFIANAIGRDIWSIIFDEEHSTKAADQLWNKVYSLGFEKEKVDIDLQDMFQYRNYLYPLMYMDKRLVYLEAN